MNTQPTLGASTGVAVSGAAAARPRVGRDMSAITPLPVDPQWWRRAQARDSQLRRYCDHAATRTCAWGRTRGSGPMLCGLAQRPEGGADLLGEQLGLLPGGEVTALCDLVEVGQGWVRLLDPAAWAPPDLVRERGEPDRDRDLRRGLARSGLGGGHAVVLPVRPGGRGAGSGEPVQRDVVEDVVAGEVARGLPVDEGAGDLLVAVGVVVEHPGGQGDGR